MLAGTMGIQEIIATIVMLFILWSGTFIMIGWWVRENIKTMGLLSILTNETSKEKRHAVRMLLTLTVCSLFANIGFYGFSIVMLIVGQSAAPLLVGCLLSIIVGIQVWRLTDSTRLPPSETPTA